MNACYQRFVLISHLRSGTHMLRTALESHPAIACQTEVFNSDNRQLPYPLSLPTQEILDRWVYRDLPERVRCAGFVLHAYHPWGLSLVPGIRQNPAWGDVWPRLAGMPGLRVIHLKRDNLLRRHFSHLAARASGVWHAWNGEAVDRVTHLGERPPASQIDIGPRTMPRLELDPRALEQDFLDVERARQFADDALCGHPRLEVTYERLCDRYDEVCREVQEFLGVSPVLRLEPAVSKLHDGPLRDAITNYEDLRRHFAGSRWGRFFDE